MKQIVLFIFFLSISAHSFSQITDSKEINSDSVIFNKVEHEAIFPGGDEAWVKYLQKNLKSNVPINKNAPSGIYEVIVRFIVAKDGTISDIEAETNHGYGMEEEVIRVIKKGPKWSPALIDGKTVNAYRRQPITFVVSD